MPCPQLKTSQDPDVKDMGKYLNGEINHYYML